MTVGLLYPLDLRCSTYAAFALTSDLLLLFIRSYLLLIVILPSPADGDFAGGSVLFLDLYHGRDPFLEVLYVGDDADVLAAG